MAEPPSQQLVPLGGTEPEQVPVPRWDSSDDSAPGAVTGPGPEGAAGQGLEGARAALSRPQPAGDQRPRSPSLSELSPTTAPNNSAAARSTVSPSGESGLPAGAPISDGGQAQCQQGVGQDVLPEGDGSDLSQLSLTRRARASAQARKRARAQARKRASAQARTRARARACELQRDVSAVLFFHSAVSVCGVWCLQLVGMRRGCGYWPGLQWAWLSLGAWAL